MQLNTIYIAGFLGGYEWILIIIAVVLLFGGKKIPELMKGLGQGMKEFKKARKDMDGSSDNTIEGEDKK